METRWVHCSLTNTIFFMSKIKMQHGGALCCCICLFTLRQTPSHSSWRCEGANVTVSEAASFTKCLSVCISVPPKIVFVSWIMLRHRVQGRLLRCYVALCDDRKNGFVKTYFLTRTPAKLRRHSSAEEKRGLYKAYVRCNTKQRLLKAGRQIWCWDSISCGVSMQIV